MSSSRRQVSTERRPRMLKDFLIDNDSNSCSSSGFESFPGRRSSIRSLMQNDVNDVANNNNNNNNNKASLLRSRSKAAASTTISAFLAIINTVRAIQLNNVVKVKPPSILPRISLSRRPSSKKKSTTTRQEIINDVKITVRVKDIIRWKSFRDLALEEKPQPQPSDLASSPDHQCTTTTTTTGSTANSSPSSCSSSYGSSWCESDFTSEYYYLPPWTGNSAENDAHGHVGEKYLPRVGSDCDSMKATIESAVGPQELHGEEKEQLSPVSVLDFELQEDEDHSVSSCDQTLANLEKWMSMEENDGDDSSAEEEEEEEEEEVHIEVEEKAKLLLSQIRTTISPTWNCKDNTIASEQLLLDFLVDELSAKRNNPSRINEMVRQAEAWIKGEDSATALLSIDDAGECVRDMDRKMSWDRFEDEQEEVSLQIENTLLNLLLDDLLLDLWTLIHVLMRRTTRAEA